MREREGVTRGKGPNLRLGSQRGVKDLTDVILPLIKEYNLQFLTSQRVKQFNLVSYILENGIIHWEDVNFKESQFIKTPSDKLVKLDFFAD